MAAALALLAAAACSKHERPDILGHWRAERMQLYSVQLPVGPDIVIREHEISSPGTDDGIPLSGIERGDDSAVLELPYDVGLSIYFDGPDRMYLKLPLVGRVYYRRVADNVAVASASATVASARAVAPASAPADTVVRTVARAPSGTAAVAASDAGVAPDYRVLLQHAEAAMQGGSAQQAQGWLEQAEAYPSAHPAVDYDLAVLAARAGDTDAALARLGEAFRRGFRHFDQLDSAHDFDALRDDVRYRALVARYR